MPSDNFLVLAKALNTSSFTSKPKLGRKISEKLAGGRPATLRIQRGGVATPAGSLTVFHSNLSNPWANRANTNLFRQRLDVTDANLVAADYQFLSNLAFVTFANYNWVGQIDPFDQQVIEIGTSLGALISSGTGAKARVDFTSENKTGDGATTAFTLLHDFELLTHCNLQVKVNAVVQASTAFVLSANATGKTVITFTVAPGNTLPIVCQLYPKPGKEFGLGYVTNGASFAYAVQPMAFDEIATRDLYWLTTGAGVTGTIDVQLIPYAN